MALVPKVSFIVFALYLKAGLFIPSNELEVVIYRSDLLRTGEITCFYIAFNL